MKQIFIIGFLVIIIMFCGCSTQKTQVQPVTNIPTTDVQPTTAPPVNEVQPTTAPSSTGDLGIKKDVEISGFAFNPNILTITKGTSVIWTNMDSATHTIISDTGNEISSDSIQKGETYAHTFDTPGTYEYRCSIHPSMKGKIIVE